MSRILFINSVCNGSTGTICKNLYKAAEKKGHICCIAYGRNNSPEGYNTIKIGNELDVCSHVLKARLIDASGFGSKYITKKFIKKIEHFNPDIIHLHNIHGYFLNIEILFDYLKQHPEIKKVWTLHDCWAFTGHCAYYTYASCNKWEKTCGDICANKAEYPKTFFSNTQNNFKRKKKNFLDIENLLLVTPSKWLRNQVMISYLKDYPIKVINNGVDTNVFRPIKSNLKKKFGLSNKRVILGVASVWDKRKGLDVFLDLSNQIPENYKIVLIGLSNKQIKKLPKNIIGIERTENIIELAKWYSLADVYFNPTYEDNYPTTNIESIACGTPVVTFNSGGSPESACLYGKIIEKREVAEVYINKKEEYYKSFELTMISVERMNEEYLNLYAENNSWKK